MPATARCSHLLDADPNDWITVDEAASLTGQSLRHWRRLASRAFHRSLACKAPPPIGKGKAVWWVHRSLDRRLSRRPDKPTREDRARAALLAKYPAHHVDRAYRKAHWLQQWRTACEQPRSAGVSDADLAATIVAEAKHEHGDDFTIGARTLQRWHCAYNTLGDSGQIRGVEALVPQYAAPRPKDALRSAEAVSFFYGLYHTQGKMSVKACHKMTLHQAGKEGWHWPASVSSTTRWLRERDDLATTCLKRKGPDDYNHRYRAYNQIDYSQLEPGELYVTDHKQCDFWCVDGTEQIRPWLTAIEDCRTRMIVGWRLGVAPHQDAILAATRMAFRDCAIPEAMRIDRGKDFCSELLTGVTKADRDRFRREYGADWRRIVGEQRLLPWQGVLGELGIELIYALPYHAWSKGQIERWFGTFTTQFCTTMATFCGNSVLSKPQCLQEIRQGYTRDQKRRLRGKYGRAWKKLVVLKFVDQSAIPTLEEARAEVGDYIELYHNDKHGAEDMANRTPLQVWKTATVLRRAAENELLALMQARGVYRVGANGVSFRTGSATVRYGAGHPALQQLMGRDVFITLDPDDISHCFAFTPDRERHRFIARLEHNEALPPRTSVDDLRKASASIGRRSKPTSPAATHSW